MTRRRLDSELVRRKLVDSRTEAKRAIEAGLVRVGALTAPKASTLVAADDSIHLTASPERYVSRAGRKLEAALDAFGIDVDQARAVDVGASTGGFTDCLLQRGAKSVTAIDVGYGQMHWRIRSDDRVEVVERTNIRTADVTDFGQPFEIVVTDLSFISLRTVRRQLESLGAQDAKWVLLIKPQFEAGRDGVGKGGIVRSESVRRSVISAVIAAYGEIGLGCMGVVESPITGSAGNVEYIALFKRGRGTVSPDTIDELFDGDAT